MGTENQNPPPNIDPEVIKQAAERIVSQYSPRPLPEASLEDDQDPRQNPVFRREAGEGWHSDGANRRVLNAIIAREAIGDALAREHDDTEREAILQEYRFQSEHVEQLKQQFDIGEAPPRLDTQQ